MPSSPTRAGPCSALQAMDSDPVLMEQYRRYSKMSQFLHSFRDTTLLDFSTVGASGYWLLRVDHLAAVHAGVSERQLEGSFHRRSRRGSPLHRGRRRSPSTGRRRHSRSRSESGSRTRRRRDSSPGRRAVQSRSRSRSTGRWEGAQRRGRPRFRSRSPVGRRSAGLAARCSARGDGSTSVFWDPVWRTERQLVRQLDVRGPMRPEDLLAAVDWPPQLDRMDAGWAPHAGCRPRPVNTRPLPGPRCTCACRVRTSLSIAFGRFCILLCRGRGLVPAAAARPGPAAPGRARGSCRPRRRPPAVQARPAAVHGRPAAQSQPGRAASCRSDAAGPAVRPGMHRECCPGAVGPTCVGAVAPTVPHGAQHNGSPALLVALRAPQLLQSSSALHFPPRWNAVWGRWHRHQWAPSMLQSLYNFLRTHLADVVWLRRSNSPVPSMVELRPWELARRDATLPGAPRPPEVCRAFAARRPCPAGHRCSFAHAQPRMFK